MTEIAFLNTTFNLDMLNVKQWNGNRLPRVLLFRQVLWGADRKPSDEAYLEATFTANPATNEIGESDALYYCGKMAKDDQHNRWSAVILIWTGDEDVGHEPYVMDTIVFTPDGLRVNEKARRAAKKVISTTIEMFSPERDDQTPVLFAVQMSGHMVNITDETIRNVYDDIQKRSKSTGDGLLIYDSHTTIMDGVTVTFEEFLSGMRHYGGGGSDFIDVAVHARSSGYTRVLAYSTGQCLMTARDIEGLNIAMVEIHALDVIINSHMQRMVPVVEKIA